MLFGPGATAVKSARSWQVVLAAGDDAEPVFDDATRALAQRLAAAGVPSANIHRLSASPAQLHGGVEPATAGSLLRRIAGLPARPRRSLLGVPDLAWRAWRRVVAGALRSGA